MIIKALTVREPWASLLMGPKRIETRPRRTSHRGPLAIHAGLTVDPYGPWYLLGRDVPPQSGYVIGLVDVVDCRPMTRADEQFALCDWAEGRFAWVVENPRRLRNPFKVRGMLGLFPVEIDE